ncbi:protein odr-4 homolog [Anopheles ziemanni]|uniref:protein odr-4 homolog n=1 Tax=Anopheles coustani TaxID=139045 RepID=UPI0026597F2A|nr:protein odr-4 homolog [Anopheles coustani]XP_058172365.1 protein odr-4 homolog [Anopheles ziemanni]
MMGRSVLCESFVEEYLRNLSRKAGICIGLLVGQPSSGGKDYIVHANRVKHSDGQVDEVVDLLDVELEQISQHALVETRMLPGGMYVLGIFVIHTKNVFEDQVLLNRIKLILLNMKATFDANPLLMGSCDELEKGEKLVFYYSSTGKQHSCKTVSLASSNPTVRPCDWKFADSFTNWHALRTHFEIEDVWKLNRKNDTEQYDTEANLTECAKQLNDQLVDAKILFDGAPKLSEDTVEGTLTMKNEKSFLVHIYQPSPTEFLDEKTNIERYNGALKFDGIISSEVYVQSRCTFGEVERFIKTDIVRSLMSRVQIHCDALVQADNTPLDKLTLNELPRRIYFPLRTKTTGSFPVQFSDYLFPEEGKDSAPSQIGNVLDISLTARDIDATVELVPAVKEDERHSADECGAGTADDELDGKLNVPVVGGIVAVVVLLVALLVYYLLM